MRKVFFGAMVGVFLGSLGVVIAQTPTIFSSIRVNGQSDLRGNVLDTTGNLTLADAVDVTGKLTTAASAAVAGAGFNLPHGVAPNSPANGDTWTTTAGMFVRVNGVTVGPLAAGGGGVTFPLLADDGNDAAPSYSFTNDTAGGLWLDTGTIELKSSGSLRMQPSDFGLFTVSNSFSDPFTVDLMTGGSTFTGTLVVGGNISNAGGAVTIADDLQISGGSIFASSFNGEGGLVTFTNLSGITTPDTSASEPGYKGIPQNIQAGNYTLLLTDAAKHIYHASGAGAGDTYTIPANASVAYPIGTVLTFINDDSNSISIAITSDTMTLAGTTSTGTRTLAENGVATAVKVTSTSWIINGTAITAVFDSLTPLNDSYYDQRMAA